MFKKARTGTLIIVIFGCVLMLFGLSTAMEGLSLEGPRGLWDPHTILFGLLPIVLGVWCLRALKDLRGSGDQEDRLRLSEVSHACGLASVTLLLPPLLLAASVVVEPEVEWLALFFLCSSAVTAMVSIVLAVAARRSPKKHTSGSGLSRKSWGWIIAGLLLCTFSGVVAYNVWWNLRFERYKETERIFIRNGLILELGRLEDGKYLSPGFDGTLTEAEITHGEPETSRLETLDGWGQPILYSTSADRRHYEMVSTGANGSVESRGGSEQADFGDDLKQDVIFADGVFRRYRWGGWCDSINLQQNSREEMENWLQRMPRD